VTPRPLAVNIALAEGNPMTPRPLAGNIALADGNR